MKACMICRQEYRPEVEVCAGCGTKLVDVDPSLLQSEPEPELVLDRPLVRFGGGLLSFIGWVTLTVGSLLALSQTLWLALVGCLLAGVLYLALGSAMRLLADLGVAIQALHEKAKRRPSE